MREDRSGNTAPATADAGSPAATIPPGSRVKAWDMPTRLFHWSLVVLIALAYFTRHYAGDLKWHKWTGYTILILIVFRLFWGVVGSSTARFSSFLYSPLTALRYGIDFLMRRPRHFLGHNPLGGTVVFVMLALMLAQAVTGLFSYDDHTLIDGGPLASKVSEAWVARLTKWHVWLFDVLLAVVALHVVANLVYLVWKRENLILPMVTGWKPVGRFEDQNEAQIAPWSRAIVCLVAAAAVVLGGITLAGGRLF